ncbi:MAG: hypothetical protein PGN11_08120 [Quadrisphaera sp.]
MADRSAPRLHPVRFYELAEWEQARAPRHVFVWVAFDHRLVATGEHEGPENHAGVWSAGGFLTTWPQRLVGTPGAWLLDHVQRMAHGEDVRDAVLADFAARHDGASPSTTVWPLALEPPR